MKSAKETLRYVWISEQQDRLHYSTHKDMQRIIKLVDRLIESLSEDEARGLL